LSQDQSIDLILLFVVSAACASIVAIGFVAGTLKEPAIWPRAWHLALSVAALMCSSLLIQTVFAFHYARRNYDRAARDSAEPAEPRFPGKREPACMDFAYDSLVIGMTSQVSADAVTSRRMRRPRNVEDRYASSSSNLAQSRSRAGRLAVREVDCSSTDVAARTLGHN
jgi:uncharacterized membrane protein